MALLTGETYKDPSLIRSSIGDSLEVADPVISNQSWGNIIDLSGSNYGLSEISMLPSRLNVMKDAEGQPIVGNNLLIFPRYGEDGRSSDFYKDSVSAVYNIDEFTYSTKQQSYGVRAIGTTSKMTVQQAALASARSQVYSYTSAAYRAATSAWKVDGEAFLDIYFRHYYLRTDGYTQADIAVIRDMAVRMRNAINYIDLALRQGVVGIAASMIEDENTFKYIRAELENQSVSLYDTLLNYSGHFEAPGQFSDWAYVIHQDEVTLSDIIRTCDDWATLYDYEFSWSEIEWMLKGLMDADHVYWNGDPYTEMEYILSDNVLTMTEDAGLVAHIADFTGDYSVFVTYLNEANIEVKTLTFVDVPYLLQISGILEGLQAASGDEALAGTPIEDIYGFSIDLAFRCNQLTNLLLQTTPETRINGTDDVYEIQGSGSYMRLESEQLDEDKILRVMDAIRVGFLDNQNKLIAVAKCVSPNSGNKWAEGYLYLHNFSVTNDGGILMGEPLKLASAIVTLTENVPTIITAVVWMDGDYVDNSLVAISGKSMTGVLNLQFSSDVALNPAFGIGNENPNGGTTTPPGSGGNDKPSPDNPVDPEPSIPTEQIDFYLEHDGDNQYSFYTMNDYGARDYELYFTGTLDDKTQTVIVEDVTEYPNDGVVIPALAMYRVNDKVYSVSIDPTAPFANLGTESAVVSFVPVGREKVGITSTVLSDMFGRNDVTDFISLDLSGLDTSSVTDMSHTFDDLYYLTSVNVSGWDTSNVTDMASMFEDCRKLTELDVSSFDTSNVTSIECMFNYCRTLIQLDVGHFDTAKVTNMNGVFWNCQSLEQLDISGWTTDKVTDMSSLFSQCRALTSLDVSRFNTSNVRDMSAMFFSCGVSSLDISHFDTSRVTDMQFMLATDNLKTIDLSNLDTSNVTNMNSMFYGGDYTELDLSGFDTSNVTDMNWMFSKCDALETLNITGWDTSEVTNMSEMFSKCTSLTILDLTELNTSSVTEMTWMFAECTSLKQVNVSNWDTSNVTNMARMFDECSNLRDIDVSGWKTDKVTNMYRMFYNCKKLIYLDMSNWNTTNVTNKDQMFHNCPAGQQ